MTHATALRHLLSRPDAKAAFAERLAQRMTVVVTPPPAVISNPSAQKPLLYQRFQSMRQRTTGDRTPRDGDSAVLIPLVEMDAQPWVLFTHRSHRLRSHRGEISFPGGRVDIGETVEEAALREANEEVGILKSEVEIWGQLPPFYARGDKNTITPVIGIIPQCSLKRLKLHTNEVQAAFVAPLYELADSATYTAFRMYNRLFRMPAFHTTAFQSLCSDIPPEEYYRIWGLSATILNELLAALLPNSHKFLE